MRPKITLIAVIFAFTIMAGSVAAQDTEQDIVNRYLEATTKKHTAKMGWASINFGIDRINRNNDYNGFANVESGYFPNATVSWLDNGYSFGADFGINFPSGLAWAFGAEYWLKMGEEMTGSFSYLPSATAVVNPSSEIQVYGASTSLWYYLSNKPVANRSANGPAIRVGGSVGYYYVSWDVWPEYQNLNLATSVPVNNNTTFKGSAPGFGINLGMDYPLKFWNLALGMDMGYLHLNFTNVAWYNGNDEEIVASLSGDTDGRVDLAFSGVRGKFEIKRSFTW